MFTALDIAKEILNQCYKKGKSISNLKLQKLLYYVQGFSFQKTNKPAFDDDICAWKYGPVVPTVYEYFDCYASKNITGKFPDVKLDDRTKWIVYNVVNTYAEIPTWELVEKTHREDPWKLIYMVFGVDSIIPKASIKKYFCGNQQSVAMKQGQLGFSR